MNIKHFCSTWHNDNIDECHYFMIPGKAYVRLTILPNKKIWISDLFVNEKYREQGLATELLDACDTARDQYCTKNGIFAVLPINIIAKEQWCADWYKRRGYIVKDDDQYDFEFDEIENFIFDHLVEGIQYDILKKIEVDISNLHELEIYVASLFEGILNGLKLAGCTVQNGSLDRDIIKRAYLRVVENHNKKIDLPNEPITIN